MPVRNTKAFKEKAEAEAMVAQRKGQIYWWPLLPGMTDKDNALVPAPAEKYDIDQARANAADLQRRQQATHNESPGDEIWRGWPLPGRW